MSRESLFRKYAVVLVLLVSLALVTSGLTQLVFSYPGKPGGIGRTPT
jgi:hypothetical protein